MWLIVILTVLEGGIKLYQAFATHTYIVEQIKTAILIYMGTFSTEHVDRNFINFPLKHYLRSCVWINTAPVQ